MKFERRTVARGLVVLDGLSPGQTGHKAAIRLVKGPLARFGIQLHEVSAKGPVECLRSFARVVLREGVRKPNFAIFNGLAALESGLWLLRTLTTLRIPIMIYWREGGIRFREVRALMPGKMATLERFIRSHPELLHVANSSWCASEVRRQYPGVQCFPVGNCAFVPPPWDMPVKPSDDPPVVVNVGRVQWKKGSDLFVRTAILVCRRHPTVEFVWLGDGPDLPACREQIREAGLQDRIFFPGYCSTAFIALRRASAFFVSSREDTFSQATAEAMCLAREVIAFESGGPPEVLGGLGVVIRDFDTYAAANAIIRILEQPSELRVEPRARERYLRFWTPERHAERLARLVKEWLNSGAGDVAGTHWSRVSARVPEWLSGDAQDRCSSGC